MPNPDPADKIELGERIKAWVAENPDEGQLPTFENLLINLLQDPGRWNYDKAAALDSAFRNAPNSKERTTALQNIVNEVAADDGIGYSDLGDALKKSVFITPGTLPPIDKITNPTPANDTKTQTVATDQNTGTDASKKLAEIQERIKGWFALPGNQVTGMNTLNAKMAGDLAQHLLDSLLDDNSDKTRLEGELADAKKDPASLTKIAQETVDTFVAYKTKYHIDDETIKEQLEYSFRTYAGGSLTNLPSMDEVNAAKNAAPASQVASSAASVLTGVLSLVRQDDTNTGCSNGSEPR